MKIFSLIWETGKFRIYGGNYEIHKSTDWLLRADCEKCDARIANVTNDNTLREKTAALWTKAQRRADHTGNDKLPAVGLTAQKRRSATNSASYITAFGKRAGYLRRLRTEWMDVRRWDASAQTVPFVLEKPEPAP